MAAPAMPAAGPQGLPLQLDVSINGEPIGFIGAFTRLPDGRMAATPAELRELGLKVGEQAIGEIVIDGLPGLSYAYDEDQQTIDFTTGDANRVTKSYDAQPELRGQTLDTGYGSVLNYAAFAAAGHTWQTEKGLASFDGGSVSLDHSLYSPHATVSNSAIVGTTTFRDAGILRLETEVSTTNQDLMLTATAGDTITGGFAWTRPVRLGGVQLRRNFDVRPDLITMPLPEFSGSAAVPSTVDVYVNNVKAYSKDVSSGPFVLSNIPVVSGQGEAQVVVRDATGRETVTTSPFSASSDLLRPGLFDYSVDLGVARTGYGETSFGYDDRILAAASLRYGLTSSVTAEAHAEGSAQLINGGLGVTAVAGRLGQIGAAISGSSMDGRTGAQVYASFDTTLAAINISASTTRSFGDYADLAYQIGLSGALAGSDLADLEPYRALDRISAGTALPDGWGGLGLGAVHIEDATGGHSLFLTSSYTRTLPYDAYMTLTSFAELGGSGNMGIGLDVSAPLGGWGYGSAGASRSKSGESYNLRVAKPRGNDDGSIGWRAEAAKRGDLAARGHVSYRTRVADLEADVSAEQTGVDATAYAEGAVVLADGGLFAGRRVDSAFAIVDAGYPGVLVYLENRPVGRTGKSGKLMVPGLNAYEANKIAIEARDLPLDAEVTEVETIVYPADRSGAAVDFKVKSAAKSAIVVLRGGDGKPIPPGSEGRLRETGESFVVGYDGQAYINALSVDNTVTVTLRDGTCTASFKYRKSGAGQDLIDGGVCL